MKKLETINQLPKEIAVKLGSNTQLQRLLVDDDNTFADEFTPLTLQELLEKEYISFAPIIDNNIRDSFRNTFLIINLEEIDFSDNDNNTSVSGAIFIGTDKQHAMLINNRLRLLELIKEVYSTLNNWKASTAGTINLQYATFVNFSEYVFGYKIVFKVVEQENVRKAEI